VTRELGLNLTGWIGIDAPGGGGVHTRGRLTVFEAFCGFRDGNPSKSNQRAKIHNPSGQDSRGGSLRRMGTAALAPALFILARSHCVGSPRSLIVGVASPEPGHWPALERLVLQNDDFPEENTNRNERPLSLVTGLQSAVMRISQTMVVRWADYSIRRWERPGTALVQSIAYHISRGLVTRCQVWRFLWERLLGTTRDIRGQSWHNLARPCSSRTV